MRYVADLCIAALCGLTAAAACQFGDNIIDHGDALGPREDIAACCDELLWGPWGDVKSCLDERTEPGVCRWLVCLKVLRYESEACK